MLTEDQVPVRKRACNARRRTTQVRKRLDIPHPSSHSLPKNLRCAAEAYLWSRSRSGVEMPSQSSDRLSGWGKSAAVAMYQSTAECLVYLKAMSCFAVKAFYIIRISPVEGRISVIFLYLSTPRTALRFLKCQHIV